jgi:hypothetical protein
MSVTMPAPSHNWIGVHRAAVAIVILSVALAVTLGLLVASLVADSPRAAAGPAVVQLDPVDNGCQLARPGQPC